MTQKPEKIEISRLKVGTIAATCLLLSLIVFLVRGTDNLWMPGLLRVGLLCSAICIALPGKNQKAAWANVSPMVAWGMLIGLIVMIRIPFRSLLILIPIGIVALIIGVLLRPRNKRRPQNRQE